MQIRRLQSGDAEAMRNLRSEALEREPSSFGESLEEFLRMTVEEHASRLGDGSDDRFIFGAFDGDALIATAGFFREQREKRRHKGTVWGVYVSPEFRGRGIARAVMTELLNAARRLPGLEFVYLSVTSSNPAARKLYESVGFRAFGTEPRALAVGGVFFDEDHMVLDLGSGVR
jgi:ribosomal protein S18 acetylase RimI-like enzyme